MNFNPNDYLINLKGKQYLQVAHRLMWFREAHPDGSVLTELINVSPIVFKATVLSGVGVVLGTGHGSATPKPNAVWAGREFEKAETAAIGRALGVAGFGTQYTESFDDDEYLSDSPVQTPPKTAATPQKSNGSPKPRATTSAAPETALTDGEIRQITLTAVISETGKVGQTRYRFASVERLEGVYAYSREVFINGGWCTENDWQKHGTYDLPAACMGTVQYHAFKDGGGGYWTVEAVENFQPDFLTDVAF